MRSKFLDAADLRLQLVHAGMGYEQAATKT
jgi:hypothetical protein